MASSIGSLLDRPVRVLHSVRESSHVATGTLVMYDMHGILLKTRLGQMLFISKENVISVETEAQRDLRLIETKEDKDG